MRNVLVTALVLLPVTGCGSTFGQAGADPELAEVTDVLDRLGGFLIGPLMRLLMIVLVVVSGLLVAFGEPGSTRRLTAMALGAVAFAFVAQTAAAWAGYGG